jgi:uncharacterized protein
MQNGAETPDLIDAIDAGDEARVRELIRQGRATDRDRAGVSATMHALYRGQPELAQVIAEALTELDIFEAAALARVARVRELLASDPGLARAFSPDGFTALHYPGFFGGADSAATALALIDAGADVDTRSRNDFSVHPIHSAVAGNRAEVVAVLIDGGADVNARQPGGFTPLHGAAQNGAEEIVDRLLAAGADPAARNDDGRSPADLAEEAGRPGLAARLR